MLVFVTVFPNKLVPIPKLIVWSKCLLVIITISDTPFLLKIKKPREFKLSSWTKSQPSSKYRLNWFKTKDLLASGKLSARFFQFKFFLSTSSIVSAKVLSSLVRTLFKSSTYFSSFLCNSSSVVAVSQDSFGSPKVLKENLMPLSYRGLSLVIFFKAITSGCFWKYSIVTSRLCTFVSKLALGINSFNVCAILILSSFEDSNFAGRIDDILLYDSPALVPGILYIVACLVALKDKDFDPSGWVIVFILDWSALSQSISKEIGTILQSLAINPYWCSIAL